MSKATGRPKVAQRPKSRAQKHVILAALAKEGYLAKTRLKKAGGSLVVTVPAVARNMLHLTEGQQLAVKVEGNRVVMEPMPTESTRRVRSPRYTLDELLADYNPEMPMSDEEQAWHDEPPTGREVW